MLSQTNVFLLKKWTCFKLQWEVSILFYIFDMFILKEAIRQVILTWTAKFVGHNLRSIIGLNKKKIPLWGSSVGCGKKRCLFLQIFRHLILTLQVCKQDDMLEILANAKTTPGGDQWQWCRWLIQLLVVSIHWRPWLVPEHNCAFKKQLYFFYR